MRESETFLSHPVQVDPRREEKNPWPVLSSPPSPMPSFCACFQLSHQSSEGRWPLWEDVAINPRAWEGLAYTAVSGSQILWLQVSPFFLWRLEEIRVCIRLEIVSQRNCESISRKKLNLIYSKILFGEYQHIHKVFFLPPL